MDKFKKILFYADGAKGEQFALERAIELAGHNRASLTVVDVVAEVDTNDIRLAATMKKLQKALIKERKDALEAKVEAASAATSKRPVRIRVVPGKDYIEIIRMVIGQKFDLLVKSANKHSLLSAALFGNTDLALMRKCPCPVWIIKPGRRTKIDRILAAVDLSETPEAVQLADRIVDIASGVANRESASLHLLNAWQTPFDPQVRHRIEGDDYVKLVKVMREEARRRLSQLLAKCTAEHSDDHLVKGDPEMVITKFVRNNKVDLLIMGTMSRSGIPGFLIGNTAEKVLNNVDCSVLTLKPADFKSPVV
ncbi:MAG: universal stress protein [Pseudomonadales bacterium]|nr:universal stress protein [Pseudomonadales bacterium]